MQSSFRGNRFYTIIQQPSGPRTPALKWPANACTWPISSYTVDPQAVYLFDSSNGNLLHTFRSPNPTEAGYFGDSVAFVGDKITIGAPGEGVVYLFEGFGLPPIAPKHEKWDMRSEIPDVRVAQKDAEYDIEFTANQELKVTLDVKLIDTNQSIWNANPSLKDTWKSAIETTWSNRYNVIDGSVKYPITVDVNWVGDDAVPDVSVTVHDGKGIFNSLNFWTDASLHPGGHPGVAAHEAGHWMGLYDEYNPQNEDKYGREPPAWWPLYDSDDATEPYLDFNALWNTNADGEPTTPLENWGDLSANADQSGLMGENGDVRERYFLEMLQWLQEASERPDLVLGQSSMFIERDPIPGWRDGGLGHEGVPEPSSLLLLAAALAGFLAYTWRRRKVWG